MYSTVKNIEFELRVFEVPANYSPTLKKGVGLYRIWVVFPSICSSVRSSVRHNLVSAQYLENKFIEFIQILYVH